MISDFSNTSIKSIYTTAKKLVGFQAIKTQVLTYINSSEDFDLATKLAIRIVADKLPFYSNSNVALEEGELLGILYMPWETVSIDSMTALSSAQREAIFNLVMIVCKTIINQHAATLTEMTGQDTTLPVGWENA